MLETTQHNRPQGTGRTDSNHTTDKGQQDPETTNTQQTKEVTDTVHEWEMEGEDDPTKMEPTRQFKSNKAGETLDSHWEDINLWRRVWEQGYPNRFGARIPIKNKWNLEKFKQMLGTYQDREVVEWIKYGWPSGRLPSLGPPKKTYKNHKGATDFPEALKRYIRKEKSKDMVMGPFEVIPFDKHIGISPISTRPKKLTDERRVIIDLSFPMGEAVNDGMIKDNYLGRQVKLTFPRVDDLALRIYTLGKTARMFKIDLSRYFRQLPLDPGDYSLIGYVIDNQLYFDKMIPMGMRTAPYIAQRVTNAIRYIHEQMKYYLLNYVDDFLGAEVQEIVWEAYKYLNMILEEIGVETAPEKMVPPTSRIQFLGITLDSQTMTMEIPRDKIKEIMKELDTWTYRTKATRTEAESLVGKLQFMGKCVKPGRVFIARLINWMKTLSRQGKHTIQLEARKDIAWWGRFLPQYNGISIIWMQAVPGTDTVIATDASKKGFGGIAGQQYFRGEFPPEWENRNIAELEIMAVIIALKIWGTRLQAKYFWIHVDNEAVATVINSGAARDPQLQTALREIAMIAAQHQFIIKCKHISGVSNRIPDWLSRWGEPKARKLFREYAQNKNLKECELPPNHLEYNNKW